MAELSPRTRTFIAQAHTPLDIPLTERMLSMQSIGELFRMRVDGLEDKPFLVYYGEEAQRREFSYREAYELACHAAGVLAKAGVRAGDRVAFLSFNHHDLVLQFFAAWMIGASCVPIDPGEDDRHIAAILQDSGARVLLVRDAYAERLPAILTGAVGDITVILCGRKGTPRYLHFETEMARPSRPSPLPDTPLLDAEALLLFTPGTGGESNAVVLTQYNVLVESMALAEWHQVVDTETMMCVLPLHHVHGIAVGLLAPLYGGSTIILNQKFHPTRFFERISAERVAVVSVVPTILKVLLHARLDMAAYKLANFRHVICGGGPLTVELATKFEQTFKIPVIHGYGLTEASSFASFVPIDLKPADHKAWLSKYGFPSIGMALPITEMAILGTGGNELDEAERGEIVLRGHNVMQGYLGDQAENDAVFAGGWLRTGDEGFFRFDEEGKKYFFITGRMKDLIVRGGLNISPFEIDQVLLKMPGVAEAMAVGFENDWYGEEVGAMVSIQPDMQISEADVLRFCRKHLPFAKSPKVVVLCDAIPRSASGNCTRASCKGEFLRWKAEQFTET